MKTKITIPNKGNAAGPTGSNKPHIRSWILVAIAWGALVFSSWAQTITWHEDWESPSAQDDWSADFGYWEIGVPTYGPPVNLEGRRAHQGTNVAATVLAGDYTDDRQSRLASAPVPIPAAGVNPRLRFWHWWAFNWDDYGQVQISTNNGASWVGLSPIYGGGSPANWDSGGQWTQAWLDLARYAGQTVRFGLYFSSHNNPGQAPPDVAAGWYVDEIMIETGAIPALRVSDDLEDAGAGDRWVADFGVWEIGVPTSGPGAAHSGSNCLATVLSGNYTDDRSSRVSSQPFVVPAAGVNPRLRFWHWWAFSWDDYGQVQISTNNGASWTALSPRYGGGTPANWDSSGRWTRAWLDLTPYAGQTVRFGLYFSSHNNPGQAPPDVAAGWYVDEIMIETGALASFLPSETFEDAGALDRWTADYGVWEIGAPTSGPGAAHSGSNCLATVLTGNYTDDRSSRVSGQPFVVPAAELNPRLRFWHWWAFNWDDYGQVQISTNNGASWMGLSPMYGGGSPANWDSSGRWTRAWLDLTPYAGQTVRFGLYFSSHNNPGQAPPDVAAGWYVDEIMIETGASAKFLPSDTFDDAGAGDRWVADFGVWEIGVPTSGPGAAHSGSNCLATILSGNYTDDRSSRVSSQPFVVPAAELNPRLRFWHWWNFNAGDYGQVQISTDNWASWTPLATYTASSPWTQPLFDLIPYAGQKVRLGFYFYSSGGGVDVAPGWYIDDVRLIFDPAVSLVGTPVVRTLDTACVSLQIQLSSPSSGVSFVLEAPAGSLGNPMLTPQGCWSGTLAPQSSTQWLVSLQSACTNVSGVEAQVIGTICFSAIAPRSAFVPLAVSSLVVNNFSAPHAYGTRAVQIANEPLIESWLDPNGKRMVSLYGKANTTYGICQSTNAAAPGPWPVGWANTVPASLCTNSLVRGAMSNAPVLFLRAREQ